MLLIQDDTFLTSGFDNLQYLIFIYRQYLLLRISRSRNNETEFMSFIMPNETNKNSYLGILYLPNFNLEMGALDEGSPIRPKAIRSLGSGSHS